MARQRRRRQCFYVIRKSFDGDRRPYDTWMKDTPRKHDDASCPNGARFGFIQVDHGWPGWSARSSRVSFIVYGKPSRIGRFGRIIRRRSAFFRSRFVRRHPARRPRFRVKRNRQIIHPNRDGVRIVLCPVCWFHQSVPSGHRTRRER